jgi:hypothetical protein
MPLRLIIPFDPPVSLGALRVAYKVSTSNVLFDCGSGSGCSSDRCSSAQGGSSRMVQRELDASVVSSVSGERACVLTRRTPPTRGLPAIICCHGRGQNHLAYGPGLATSDPIMRLVEAGYVAISLDNGGTTSWGNDNAIQTITDAVAYSAAQFGTSTTRVLLFGMSMGSLPALSWAARNASKVAAIALSFPVTDLAAMHSNGAFTAEIDTAYGGSSGYTSALSTHSPIVASLSAAWSRDPPLQVHERHGGPAGDARRSVRRGGSNVERRVDGRRESRRLHPRSLRRRLRVPRRPYVSARFPTSGGGITVESDPIAEADLATHAAAKTGVHGIPSMSSGQGLVWNGTAWVATDVATQAELDAEAAARASAVTAEATARTAADTAHAGLSTSAHGGIVASTDSRLTDQRTPLDASVTDAKIATTLSPSKVTGTAVVTADARLSDARTPTAGSVVDASVAGGAAIAESKLNLASDAAAATASRRTLGTGATQAAAGNDSRLSDTRTPTDGTVTDAKVASSAAIAESKLSLASDAAAGTASRRTLGTGATQATAGNDSRLSDARTPTSHHATHEPGGSDALDLTKLHAQGTHAARLAASHAAGVLWRETDTGLIYRDNGTTWDIYKSDGQVRKTADETVNNSAAVQNDDELLFPVEVNEVWFVEAFLYVNGSSTTADWLLGWAGPTGMTAIWSLASGVNSAWVNAATGSSPVAPKAMANTVTAGSISGDHFLNLAGWFTVDATHNGNVTLQWAQNTATVENNKVLKNSYLRLRRLA